MASIGMGLNYIISSWRNFKCPEDCWGQNKTCVRVLAPSRFVGKFINNSSFASELNPCAQLTRIMCLRFIDWPLSAAVCDCLRGCEWELKRVGPGGEGGWRFEGELPNTTIDGNCVVLKMLMQIIGEIKNGEINSGPKCKWKLWPRFCRHPLHAICKGFPSGFPPPFPVLRPVCCQICAAAGSNCNSQVISINVERRKVAIPLRPVATG